MRLREALLMMVVPVTALATAHAQEPPSVTEEHLAASAPGATLAVPMAPAAPAISASAAHAAAQAVREDPLMPGKQKIKFLRFKKSEDKKPDPKDEKPFDLEWWKELLANLSTGLRVAMWLVGAAFLIWVLLRVREWVRIRARGPVVAAVAPTHVGSLDIRPESLPDDIGAAARGLWQRGDVRAALSLLYRGALSRLVHGHGVPIRAASTESDCLALSANRLAPASHAFLAQLVSGWQMVAYARRELPSEDFEQLCANFDARLTTGGAA